MDFLSMNILEIGNIKRKAASISTTNKGCCALGCRINGSANFNTADGVFNINRGDIIFVPVGASYSQTTDGEDIIYIHLELFGDFYNGFQHIKSENPDEICDTFREIASVWFARKENYKLICLSLLYSLVAKTSVMLPKKKKGILSDSVCYMNEQFSAKDFSLSKACGKGNISRAYFNRIFAEEYKMTPLAYINKLKIDKAKFLLLSGGYTNEEIAFLCGFNDVKYFYTVFKKVVGCTVGKYYKNATKV